MTVRSRETAKAGSAALLAVEALRANGERVTQARRAILEVLERTDAHLNADEISAQAAAMAPGTHRATVYRALATLRDLGMVTHTHVGGAATVYHLAPAVDRVGGEGGHTHVQCTSCGTLIDVPAKTLRPLVIRLERDLGFQLEPQHAALLGRCAACAALSARRRSPPVQHSRRGRTAAASTPS